MNPFVIETKGLCRSFKGKRAVNQLDLQVRRGSIYGFLGRNGAGKTTTIKMLAGLIWPDEGQISVNDVNPRNFTVEDRQKVSYLSERQVLPGMYRVGKLIDFCANLYPTWDHQFSERILKQFKIDPSQKIDTLSLGGARQVGLLLALAPKPDLLLLDEPAGGLDVVARRDFLDQMLELIREDGKTVFFSSHILSDVERVADEIGIIRDGKLVISESLDDLKESIKQVRFYNFAKATDDFSIPEAFSSKKSANEVLVTLRVSDEAQLQHLAQANHCQYEIHSLGLEDIFIEIVREA